LKRAADKARIFENSEHKQNGENRKAQQNFSVGSVGVFQKPSRSPTHKSVKEQQQKIDRARPAVKKY